MHETETSPAPEPQHEADLMLAQAARLELGLMQHMHNLALEKDDVAEVTSLARACAVMSRAMRMNLALVTRLQADRVKLVREAERHEAWKRDHVLKPYGLSTREADAQALRAGVGRIIAATVGSDRPRHTALVHRLEREVDDWNFDPEFDEAGELVLQQPDLDDNVRALARRLNLPDGLARQWRRLPEPDWAPEPEIEAAPLRPSSQPPNTQPHWADTG